MNSGRTTSHLGEIISFERGLTYGKGDEVAFSSVGVLRSNNVDLATHSLNLEEIKFLRSDFQVPDKKKVKKSSLLMCMSNGSKDHLGKVALIDRDLDYAFGGFMGLITPDESKVLPKYLLYVLASKSFKDYIHNLADGANINNLRFKDLAGFEIPLPSLPEQQHIVGVLDQELAKIDALKAKAEQSLQATKDLFQATLKMELAPKEGWHTTTIGALCDSVKYGTSKPSSLTGHFTYLRMNNITNDGFLTLADTKRIDITTKEEDKYLVRKGDILFNRTNSRELVGKTCVFQEEEPMVIAGYIIRLRVKNVVNPNFISYYINHEPVRAELRKLSVGAVHQSNINAKTIQSFSICLPKSIEEQNHIVQVLSNIHDAVQQLQENYQKTLAFCDDLKQALLRKAFNGEL